MIRLESQRPLGCTSISIFRSTRKALPPVSRQTKAIGGRAWPNFIPEQDEWTLPLVLWSNTTLGLLAFWWIGTRQQQGRACLTITQLPRLTVLDPRALSKEQLAQAESIFERFEEKEFLPANEAYRDDTRQALDRAVLVDLLQLPEALLEPLAILRDQWCAEPSVHGGKKTRALLLYKQGLVSIGRAAEIAGLTEQEIMQQARDSDIQPRWSETQVQEESA